MTLDVITSTAFGIDTDTVTQGDSIWLQKVRLLFDASQTKRSLPRRIMLFLMSKYSEQIIFRAVAKWRAGVPLPFPPLAKSPENGQLFKLLVLH